jgi:hypothetical protein
VATERCCRVDALERGDNSSVDALDRGDESNRLNDPLLLLLLLPLLLFNDIEKALDMDWLDRSSTIQVTWRCIILSAIISRSMVFVMFSDVSIS